MPCCTAASARLVSNLLKNMSLDSEIEEIRKSVRTDAYQMSIGEILNMYSDGELIINPDGGIFLSVKLLESQRAG